MHPKTWTSPWKMPAVYHVGTFTAVKGTSLCRGDAFDAQLLMYFSFGDRMHSKVVAQSGLHCRWLPCLAALTSLALALAIACIRSWL